MIIILLLISPIFFFGQVGNKYDTLVDVNPEPIEGESNLVYWIKIKSQEISSISNFDCLSGEKTYVLASIVIDEKGNSTEPMILEGINKVTNQETLKILKNMELKWKPATYKKEPRKCLYYFRFNLCPEKQLIKREKNKK